MRTQLEKHNSLLPFVQTSEQGLIVQAVEKSRIIAKCQPEQVLQVVAKWRLYVGMPKGDVSEELAIVTDFIYQNYGHLTLDELELAYNLTAQDKFDVEFFGYFSPMYVGKVLSSYLHYRKIQLADAIRDRERKALEEMDKGAKPTPEEHCRITKEIFKSFYDRYKQTGVLKDVMSICYNHLRKHNMLKLTKPEIDEAMKYGEDNVEPDLEKSVRAYEVKVLARSFCVQKYFDKVSIDIILDNIKPEQFT